MMVFDIYFEGDESDANVGWHNHGIVCLELARVGWFISVRQNLTQGKLSSHTCV